LDETNNCCIFAIYHPQKPAQFSNMLKLFSRKWLFRFRRLGKDFRQIIALIFILGFLNIFYKLEWTSDGLVAAFNLWNPSWLLFGPLLYCAYRALANNPVPFSLKHSLHVLPFLVFGFFYIYVSLTTNLNHNPWASTTFTYYQNSYGVVVLSLVPYSAYVLSKILLVNTKNRPDGDALVISIGAIFILISVLICMMIIGWGIIHVDMGIDYRYFSYTLLFFANIAIGWYWFNGDKNTDKKHAPTVDDLDLKAYKNSALNDDLALIYKERIMGYFEDPKVYLTSGLSLDHLSKELDIPKHLLSQLFNIYFGKSYHHFVADYRILHAIELLNTNNGRLTIESLCYSCGFNSKTSFNKYFKVKTGTTPSAYQLQMDSQSA
jgi:AraC-like DNA-binding protein